MIGTKSNYIRSLKWIAFMAVDNIMVIKALENGPKRFKQIHRQKGVVHKWRHASKKGTGNRERKLEGIFARKSG
jgi:hypothetical protein